MKIDLKTTLKGLGLKQTELAKLLDVRPRTVSQWATGETAVPGPVRAYLRVLNKLPERARADEFNYLKERNKMLDEGIYELDYKVPGGDQLPGESALCVLRSGKILGSDRWGGVFQGSYEFDGARETNMLHVRLKMPPEGELVTGFSGGPEGAYVDVSAEIDRATPASKAVVNVAGDPIELEIKFVGPLPR